jgi:hypothetical protein
VVSRNWFACCAIVLTDCSDGALRSGSISLIAGDSLDLPAAEQPRVILRCEQGLVAAYLSLDGEEGSVPIELDSVPACSEPAP